MNIPNHNSESLETIFWVKILKFFDTDSDPGIFLTLDPGSEMEKIRIRDKHLGSATRYFPVPPEKLSVGSERSERGFIQQVKGEIFSESQQNFASDLEYVPTGA